MRFSRHKAGITPKDGALCWAPIEHGTESQQSEGNAQDNQPT